MFFRGEHGRDCSRAAVHQVPATVPHSLSHYRHAFGEVGNYRAGASELARLLCCCHQHCSHSNRTLLRKESTLKAPPMAQVPGWITSGGSLYPRLSMSEAPAGQELCVLSCPVLHTALDTPPDRDSKIEARILAGHGLVPTLPWHMPFRQGPGPGAQADCPACTSGQEISL